MPAHGRSVSRSASLASSILAALLLPAVWLTPWPAAAVDPPDFVTFESGQVRPLALSADASRLFAANTPDSRLEIFGLGADAAQGFEHLASVAVGLEPVAVAVRSPTEVWVVNHLSDSVSVVDVGADPPRVVRTLLVGDEPRDIVFAGPGRSRAFITTAHRGQHRIHPSLAGVPGAGDPQLTTPGIGRADVWVFDATNLGTSIGGTPLRIVELFGDTPRALAVSTDGATVYAAVFMSGNRTATVPEQAVCDGFNPTDEADACPQEFPGVPGGNPGPATNHAGAPAPEVGLIVRYDDDSNEWRDELGRDWSAAIRFDLPDLDVFAIDATSLEATVAYPHVGTVLFNMAVNPVSGKLYVSNTEARNEARFEGPGDFAGATLQGHLHEARLTVISPGSGEVAPRHLNKHLDYSLRPAPASSKRHSLSMPAEMAVSSDGETLYVAAFGSSKIGVFATAELEDDTFDPVQASRRYLRLESGGPSGLVLDEGRGLLYVLQRYDNALTAIDPQSGAEIHRALLHNPEPEEVVLGRRILYEANRTSSNGEASCGSCHVFGDLDGLAWDLGDPDSDVTASPILTFRQTEARAFDPPINGTGEVRVFHPMKGPMTTQTLRGLKGTGALHWRGDRANGKFGASPDSSELSFTNFSVAFKGLLGHRFELSEAQMKRFSDFILSIFLPPNPNRAFDHQLTAEQRAGRVLFDSRAVDTGIANRRCESCHVISRLNGNFGTRGFQSFIGETQIFKIPHLRNLYQKVGMFGSAPTSFLEGPNGISSEHMGDQIRGFGFLHDGSVDTVFHFVGNNTFRQDETGLTGFVDDTERRTLEQFLLAFETDLAPVVGQQITLTRQTDLIVRDRIKLFIERADETYLSGNLGGVVRECDLIVKGIMNGIDRGAVYSPVTRRFELDRAGEDGVRLQDLRLLARRSNDVMTFTCVPPGSGQRMGVDRDLDGFLDGDEIDAGSDPADANSVSPP